MSSYRGTAENSDRTRAIAAVIAVHAVLAAIIISGLNVRMVSRVADELKTFDIAKPPPPRPEPRPKPTPKAEQVKKPAGAPAPKAEPTPVVAPPPRLPLPPPIPAAKVAGTGSAASSGAGTSGNGTGAGGSGNGPGGGGRGDFSGYTPARLVRNLSRGDYRSITAGALPYGSADVAIVISSQGNVSGCRVIHSSGAPIVDSRLCPLIMQRLWFRPALDAAGRPIDFQTNFHATWSG